MIKQITQSRITRLEKNQIFVFGSNAEGNHVGGAAKIALEKFGAVMGIATGIQGQSYAINTMSGLEEIKNQIPEFTQYVQNNQDITFFVTALGCGIAGFTPEQIAPLFYELSDFQNVCLPQSFWDVLKSDEFELSGFKGFNSDMSCRHFKYEEGKNYTHEGQVKACNGGFHYCLYPLDVFGYYPPNTSVFREVVGSGKKDKELNGDSKVSVSKIHIGAEISLSRLVEAAIKFTFDRTIKTKTKENHATGDQGAASATGYRGAASATGYRGAASATGDRGAASATGYQGAASATGDQGAASATGDQGAASATGYRGAAVSLGIEAKAKAMKGGWITLAEWGFINSRWERIDVKTFAVDGEKVKEDTFYKLMNGELVEIENSRHL